MRRLLRKRAAGLLALLPVLLSTLLSTIPTAAAAGRAAPLDHHQHLLSAAMTADGQKPIDARALIAMLDAAGIRRAVVLSNAYRFGSALGPPIADEYARVVRENDWTASEAAKYPQRLVAFCSFNPLKEYALMELERCARSQRFGRGIKLHLGSSDVDLDDPVDLSLLRRVFRAANHHRMAILVHLRVSESRHRAYGAGQAQVFIDELLTVAPDIPIQIAHLGGGGGGSLDTASEQVLGAFAAALTRGDPRVKRLYFDLAGVTSGAERAPSVVQHIRAIGVAHVLYGSDGGDPTDPPAKAQLAAYRALPLSVREFGVIDGNVAPYLLPLRSAYR